MITFSPFTMITLSPFQKKIIKYIGYPLFFIFAFIIFLTMTFPGERFVPVLEGKLSETTGRKVSIEELSVSPFGSVTLFGVRIEIPVDEKKIKEQDTQNKDKNDKKNNVKNIPKPEYLISELKIDIGIMALIFGDLNIEASFDFLGGNVELSYNGSISEEQDTNDENSDKEPLKKIIPPQPAANGDKAELEEDAHDDEESEMSIHLEATDLNLIQLADLKDILPMPLYGTLSFGMDIKSSNGMLASSEGSIWLKGNGLSIGKGQSKIEIMDGMGPMTVDSIGINDFDVQMKIAKGKCSFDKFKVVSRDIDITATGDVQLRDPFNLSNFNLYFAFKLLDGYALKSPNAKTLMSLIPGAIPRAKRADGYFGFLYSGRTQNAKFRPQSEFRGSDRTSNRRLNRRRNRVPRRTSNTPSPIRRMPYAPSPAERDDLSDPEENDMPDEQPPVQNSAPSRLSEPVRPSGKVPSIEDMKRAKAAADEAAVKAVHSVNDNSDEAESHNDGASEDMQEMEIEENEAEEPSPETPSEETEESEDSNV
ncbi:MAG: type II secretion system protein GspN [Deltaproteobacteria bacterium]|nr:type II secretion system protein GspN [Deltaproteobacteria bacterium]